MPIRVVEVERVIEVLKELGVVDATEEYFEGWNKAIDGAIASIENLYKLEGLNLVVMEEKQDA